MGAIYQHDVEGIIKEFNIENYVETGTGEGDCLIRMVKLPFKQLFSIEIYPPLLALARTKFAEYGNCHIMGGNSFEVLPEILSTLKGNVLFFLDAHFPGADFGYTSHASEKDYNTRLPLEQELRTIIANRDVSKDVFIIDDLRIYEDGDFSDGNWPLRSTIGGKGIDFVFDLFNKTHSVERDMRYQGFIILKPKNV